MSEPTGRLQHGLAEALGHGLKQALDAHHHSHEEHRHDEKLAFLEILEGEAGEHIKGLLAGIHEHPDIPENEREMLGRILNPEHPAGIFTYIAVAAAIALRMGGSLLDGPMSVLHNFSMRNFGEVYPDGMEGAAAYARDRISEQQAEQLKNYSGYNNIDLETMRQFALGTISPGQAQYAWNRGLIDGAEWLQILRHNSLDELSQRVLTDMRYGPPSAAQALNAAVENQLTEDEGKEILRQNGIDPIHWDWLYRTNGASPGVEMLNKLKNYGLIDDKLWTEGILESPIKNKYVDVLKNTRFHRPPMRVTLSMLHNGVIDKPKALEYLEYLGFFPEDAEAMADAAMKQKSSGTKTLTAANLRGMYVEGILDAATVEARMTELGYSAEDAALEIQYADHVRDRQRVNIALTRIRTLYVSHKIDEATAGGYITELGVPTHRRDELLHDWKVEHDATVKHLTLSELVRAAKAGFLTPDEFYQRLVASGYSESDAHLSAQLHGIPPTGNAPLKDLTVKQISEFVKAERLSDADGLARLLKIGYTHADARLILDAAEGIEPQ